MAVPRNIGWEDAPFVALTSDQRAAQLLHDLMTPEQRATWAEHGYCQMSGDAINRFCLIQPHIGVLELQPEGCYWHCVRSLDLSLPKADQWLSLLLWFRADKPGLGKIAQRRGPYSPDYLKILGWKLPAYWRQP